MYSFDSVKKTDPELAEAIRLEMDRQQSHLELIASENFVSEAVCIRIILIVTERQIDEVCSGDNFLNFLTFKFHIFYNKVFCCSNFTAMF